MIDLDFLEKLLELLNSSHAGAIEVRKNLWSTTIRVSKDSHFANSGPVTYQVAAAPAVAQAAPVGAVAPAAPVGHSPDVSGAAGGPAAAPETASAAATRGEPLVEVKSPMVGTFYAQPEPGAQPYVRVGSRIAPGQTLCIIEAMKIMNPIDAEIAGVIREVAVQDAQPVEFGQVLFRVDPNA
jgi:acetyl-CoA carboxylase biotin carboxyl carrier protein